MSITLKPITEHSAYFTTDSNQIFGITGSVIESVKVYDSDDNEIAPMAFSIVDGVIYITVRTYVQGDPIPDTDPVQYESVELIQYFQQSGSTIEEVQSVPAVPEPVAVEIDESPFRIVSGDYNGMDISSVYQGTSQRNFLPVTGAIVEPDGLWFYVSETYGTAKKGLWYWPVGKSMVLKKPSGRLW